MLQINIAVKQFITRFLKIFIVHRINLPFNVDNVMKPKTTVCNIQFLFFFVLVLCNRERLKTNLDIKRLNLPSTVFFSIQSENDWLEFSKLVSILCFISKRQT